MTKESPTVPIKYVYAVIGRPDGTFSVTSNLGELANLTLEDADYKVTFGDIKRSTIEVHESILREEAVMEAVERMQGFGPPPPQFNPPAS
ncbi:hypothetical protein UFOVP965_83 [uncultured Caudovirales phage]|uniref:Uncharacterized protein n=1 Tax=uncultured Caudovirales phage TaxID=2100421 RepID=A0A6J5QXR8_9CAUD|nr:hypothetical protein UFOVP965_83 [uncultured Caudovirales phage]CAB4179847.1 hypothetical protein UFOVP1035_79 [uncultured Caudovirales phage]CAB4188592.1 hypothetical protein UFOVP1181_38 [uncultured Caudovirales phage]